MDAILNEIKRYYGHLLESDPKLMCEPKKVGINRKLLCTIVQTVPVPSPTVYIFPKMIFGTPDRAAQFRRNIVKVSDYSLAVKGIEMMFDVCLSLHSHVEQTVRRHLL